MVLLEPQDSIRNPDREIRISPVPNTVLGHRGPENPVASMACLKGIHSLNARSTFCGKHILDEARSVTSKTENR